jgi:hypothetical protein
MARPHKRVSSEDMLLYLASQRGFTVREIAEAFGIAPTTAYRSIVRARRAGIPDLEVLIPLYYSPAAPCDHKPIQVGDMVYCAVCHQTGIEAHPLLSRDPKTDPKPDKKPRGGELGGGKGRRGKTRKVKPKKPQETIHAASPRSPSQPAS